ncbi:MAG: hypothetical protein ABF338_09310, partial [Hyphomonas sp.]
MTDMSCDSQAGSRFRKAGRRDVDQFVYFRMRDSKRRADHHCLSDGTHDQAFIEAYVTTDIRRIVFSREV